MKIALLTAINNGVSLNHWSEDLMSVIQHERLHLVMRYHILFLVMSSTAE